jgi:hypothetical protein
MNWNHVKLKCKHYGCTANFREPQAHADHESQPHTACKKCGKKFVRLQSHLTYCLATPIKKTA